MTDILVDLDYLLDHHSLDDPLVIETVIRAYYAPIHRLANSILNDSAEADDAVQETFIKATLNIDQYRTGTNFNAWLYTIAVNTCRGMLRKRGVRERWQAVLSYIPFSGGHPPYPEEHVIETEAHTQLKTAVTSLDEKHRLPVILRFVHGLPIAEIAQILGVREGTVHSRLHYAIRKLKVQLETADLKTSQRVIEAPK